MENAELTVEITELTPEQLRAAEFEARAIAAESRVDGMVKKLSELFTKYEIGYSKYQYIDKKYLPSEISQSYSYSSYNSVRVPEELRIAPDRNTLFDFSKLKNYIDEVIAIKPTDPWNEIYSVAKAGSTFDREMEGAYRTRVHELTEKLAAVTAEMKSLRLEHTRELTRVIDHNKQMINDLVNKRKSAIKHAEDTHAIKLAAIEADHKKFVAALHLKLKPDYSAYTSKIIQLNEEILAANAIIAKKTAENLKISELNQQLEQSRTQANSLCDQVNKLTSEKKKLSDKIAANAKLTNELINKLAAANEDVVYLNEKLIAVTATTATAPTS